MIEIKMSKNQKTILNGILILEKRYNIKLRLNTNKNSVYFKLGTWNYRVSNHKNKNGYFKGIDIIHKKPKDMIKKIDDILYCYQNGLSFEKFKK